MKEELITDALVRGFLLGRVSEEERERIENLFLTDPQARERVLSLEQDLIEEYLENSLSSEDKKRFLLLHAQTEEQRRQLRITQSIRDWAATEARAPQPAPASASTWSRLRAPLSLKPVFVVPIAVMIVIAIVLGIVWLNSRKERQKHLAIEQELAQLNSPASLRQVPSQMISLELRPVTVRSVEPEAEFSSSADGRVVELHLFWSRKERYLTYHAEIRRVTGETYAIPNLQTENQSGNVIRLRLPAHFLHRGHYQILLRGLASDGSLSPAEEYSFAVSG